MNHNVPIHDFSISEENETLFEIFVYNPLTVITPILAANFEPHRHRFYEVMYLTGGKGDHIIDFETYEHRPPALYFLSPGQIHFLDLSEKIEGYVFLFKENFLVSSILGGGYNEFAFFQSMLDSPAFALNPGQQARLEPLVDTMLQEVKEKEVAQKSALQAYFHIFLVTIQRICGERQEMDGEVSLVRQFKKLVSHDINCNCDIKSCAAKLGVSVTHLRNTLREKTGKSPSHIIRQEVAMEAKRLLIHSDRSAAEIAYSLGFEDPSYFGRYFKRESGVSPSGFRRQISEKYHFKVI